MIDLDKLDKRRTYIVLEYGTGAISKIIQKLTEDFCKQAKQVPSHVLALVYEDKIWRVYESHMKPEKDFDLPSGVRTYEFDTFAKAFPKIVKKGEVYQIRFNKKKLKNLLGQPYGMGDIEALLRASIFNRNGKQKDRKGLICSEYLADCYAKIRKYFYLPAHCITPAHWLRYILEKRIERIS